MANKERLNEEASMNNNLTSSTYMKEKTANSPSNGRNKSNNRK